MGERKSSSFPSSAYTSIVILVMSEIFHICGQEGKKKLSGTLPVYGAKNAALKILAAAPLFEDKLTITNVPDILDVHALSNLLEAQGVEVSRPHSREVVCTASGELNPVFDTEISQRLRASVTLTGPMLARTKTVTFPHPGGCVIGARPIDMFLSAYEKMGAEITKEKDRYVLSAPGGLHGADIFFRVPSVTGTETIMMTAVLADGVTCIRNAAMEPEIVHLAEFLNTCGAAISGAGTPTITITGGSLLSAEGTSYVVPPDRIETGSFLILAALAGDEVTVTGTNPEEIRALLSVFESLSIPFSIDHDRITVSASVPEISKERLIIKTSEYPGFPTDLQAPLMVLLTQARGEALIFEAIFEGRLAYTEELNHMGADIVLMDPHRALVKGPRPLRGRELESPDLRAGLAFLLAAIIAKGDSVLHNVENIDRGYERIEERLQSIGVSISRKPYTS